MTLVPQSWRRVGELAPGVVARRALFVTLLGVIVLMPQLDSNGFEFPAVANAWTLAPLSALFMLPWVGLRPGVRWLNLDLAALMTFSVALAYQHHTRSWPVLLIYPPLAYLLVRLLAVAGIGRARAGRLRVPVGSHCRLPTAWLLVGIVVLAFVHLSWALGGHAQVDVAAAGVQGAREITGGHAVYATPAHEQTDEHLDTYGPVNYEAYIPLVELAPGSTTARLTTLLFELLTAAMLFQLGRRIRGPSFATSLAFAWLAFPMTMYEDALGFNDSIVAAALVGTVLLAGSPIRRGAMAAVAGWTKLSPLALVPLLASYNPRDRRAGRGRPAMFAVGFALATLLTFAPVLAHSPVATFVHRTLGFQGTRAPASSIWAIVQDRVSSNAAWLNTVTRVAHGLLAAGVGAFALLLPRVPRRQDVVGVSAAAAAVLVAVELCLGYYAFSYILWFAPLALIALLPAASVEPEASGDIESMPTRQLIAA